MKNILILIAFVSCIACKKKEEEIPKPIQSAQLIIKYSTEDPTDSYKMRINYTINNSIYESKDVNGPAFEYIGTANSGTELSGSLIENGGMWREVTVWYNNDTVFYEKSHSNIAWKINLPTLE